MAELRLATHQQNKPQIHADKRGLGTWNLELCSLVIVSEFLLVPAIVTKNKEQRTKTKTKNKALSSKFLICVYLREFAASLHFKTFTVNFEALAPP